MLYRNVLVFVGAGLGGVARYYVGVLFGQVAPGLHPCWGTCLINVTGCFVIGSLMYLFKDRQLLGPFQRLFLMVGVLGGYTTFSSFGYESDTLARRGQVGVELAYVLSSVVGGVGAVVAGRAATRLLERRAARPSAAPAGGGPPPGRTGPLSLKEEAPE